MKRLALLLALLATAPAPAHARPPVLHDQSSAGGGERPRRIVVARHDVYVTGTRIVRQTLTVTKAGWKRWGSTKATARAIVDESPPCRRSPSCPALDGKHVTLEVGSFRGCGGRPEYARLIVNRGTSTQRGYRSDACRRPIGFFDRALEGDFTALATLPLTDRVAELYVTPDTVALGQSADGRYLAAGRLRWTDWGFPTPVGEGVLLEGVGCTPQAGCASTRPTTTPVTLTAADRARCGLSDARYLTVAIDTDAAAGAPSELTGACKTFLAPEGGLGWAVTGSRPRR